MQTIFPWCICVACCAYYACLAKLQIVVSCWGEWAQGQPGLLADAVSCGGFPHHAWLLEQWAKHFRVWASHDNVPEGANSAKFQKILVLNAKHGGMTRPCVDSRFPINMMNIKLHLPWWESKPLLNPVTTPDFFGPCHSKAELVSAVDMRDVDSSWVFFALLVVSWWLCPYSLAFQFYQWFQRCTHFPIRQAQLYVPFVPEQRYEWGFASW